MWERLGWEWEEEGGVDGKRRKEEKVGQFIHVWAAQAAESGTEVDGRPTILVYKADEMWLLHPSIMVTCLTVPSVRFGISSSRMHTGERQTFVHTRPSLPANMSAGCSFTYFSDARRLLHQNPLIYQTFFWRPRAPRTPYPPTACYRSEINCVYMPEDICLCESADGGLTFIYLPDGVIKADTWFRRPVAL